MGDLEGFLPGPFGVGWTIGWLSARLVDLQQLVNLLQGEAQLLRVADEAHAGNIAGTVGAVAAGGSRRLAQQFLPFIKAQGLDGHACRHREFANAHNHKFTWDLLERNRTTTVPNSPVSS